MGADLEWVYDKEHNLWTLTGRECFIWIAQRPHYCDRGNYLAHLEPSGWLVTEMDHADRWPRYYFDLDRACLECEAWVLKRKQEPCDKCRDGLEQAKAACTSYNKWNYNNALCDTHRRPGGA